MLQSYGHDDVSERPFSCLQPCVGLGGDAGLQLAAATFDIRQPVRAFGATKDGQLLWLSLGNAKTFQRCQVRSRC